MTPHQLADRLTAWVCRHRRPPYFYADSFTALASGQRPVETSSDFDQLAATLYRLKYGGPPLKLPPNPQPVSRNWIAMRALNLSLNRGDHSLWPRILAWQTAPGLFPDSPLGRVTPVTYHAKFCLVLAMAAREGVPGLQHALDRGLDALEKLVSPTGVLVPYGRSRATLFGYAAAATALLSQGRARGWLLYDRMLAHLEPDGHIPAVLGPPYDRDDYVNDSDYNAYTAALLRWLEPPPRQARPKAWLGCAQLGPLALFADEEQYLAIAGRGESEPWNTPYNCDHRTHGLQPLWWERGGKVVLTPPPPPGEGYLPRTFPAIGLERRGRVLRLEGTTRATRYVEIPRWLRGLLFWLERYGRLPRYLVLSGRPVTRTLELEL